MSIKKFLKYNLLGKGNRFGGVAIQKNGEDKMGYSHPRPTEKIVLEKLYAEHVIDELYDMLGFKHYCWLVKRLEGYSSVELAKSHGVTRQAVENALRLKLQKYNPEIKSIFRTKQA